MVYPHQKWGNFMQSRGSQLKNKSGHGLKGYQFFSTHEIDNKNIFSNCCEQ